MKTQFWTRKGYLGLLMALVLAFSVQGIADALTVTRRSSDDLEIRDQGDSDRFKVSFSVSDVDAADTNAELTIPSFEGMTLKRIGSSTVIAGHEDGVTLRAVLEDGNESYQRLRNTNYTLEYAVDSDATAGAQTITLGGVAFTVYIVNDATTTEAEGITIGGEAYSVRGNQDSAIPITVTLGSSLPVTFSVSGGGRVYVRVASDRTTSATSSLTTSTDAPVFLSMNSRTNKVTVTIQGLAPATATYIYGNPRLQKVSGTGQTGIAGGRLEEPLVVKLVDFGGRSVSGIPVAFSTEAADDTFMAVPGETLYIPSGGELRTATTTRGPNDADPFTAYTDSGGEASVYYEFASDATGIVDIVAAVADTTATATFQPEVEATTRRPTLAILSGNNQRTDENGDLEEPLVVVVRQSGRLKPGEQVEFRTVKGTLDGYTRESTISTEDLVPRNDKKHVWSRTNGSGEAQVTYYQDPGAGSDTVTATISGDNYEKEVIFGIDGGRTTGGAPDPDPSPPPSRDETPELTISTTGEGTTRSVTVTATNAQGIVVPGLAVTLSGTAVTPSEIVVSGTPTTITLPDTPATYTLQASASGYTVARINLTVAAPPQPGTLSIARVGDRIGGQQAIRVTAQTSGGSAPSSAVLVTLSGATIPPSLTIPGGDGSISLTVTLPSATDAHVLTVSATGYDSDTAIVPAGTGQQTGDPSQPTTGTTGEADSLEIDGSRQLSRNVNQATPLRVRVVDVNSRGVSDVRVTFRILAPGQGRLSQRGNGRAVQVNTDRNGYASASLTPLGGDVIVEAKAAGVSASVTFIIDVSGTTTTPTPTPTPSTDAPSSQMINPEDADVHVGAAQRSPMLWVDSGAIYALVDADVQRFAPSVENALHITVGGSKVYWTAQTGTSSGTINSANLDGSGVTELKSIMAVPIGIAVDTDARKLYWTNSRGRIQSANLNGSSVTNVLENLEGATDIAVARGLVYWTQFDATTGQGRLGIMNPNAGQNGTRYISTGSDSPMSLTINGNKVYWTEQTGVSSGTINSANLNGSGVKQLASIRAVPSGMGVDMARSHLYWTNSRGRIQRADLDGKQIQNVADGLGSPGDMVLSNSIPTPTAVTSTTPTPTPTADNAQYDVNGDGLVNNTDASLVAGAMNTSNTKYDVNGDGTVNFLDLLLVFDNRDEGAASAPTVLGMQLSAVQVDVLQEQIDLLIATGDRSPAAMRTLIYLQQLIATARPEQTQLLANYPNPFNPETWIPYELATDTDVRLTIYNTHGVVIRTLQLGHQSAGYYVGRDRAAYWDGRNAFGEQVASGIYFYQLETDAMSLMRKMVILK